MSSDPDAYDAEEPTLTVGNDGEAMPERVGPYKVVGRLGSGGMGLVLEAVHEELCRPVALKLLRGELSGDQEFVDRFLREARAGSEVDHPNVVGIYEAGRADSGELFMACQLVRGKDLGVLTRNRGTLTEHKALSILVECCKGLQALHEAGLVHRDIKPGNIFLGEHGEALIGDLGLARHADGDDRMTMTGTAMGTPAYMSPEHVRGLADVDIRSDVYALGATLFRILTGQEPFPGDTLYVVTHKILTEELTDPRRLNTSISAEAAAIIKKCMAKDRDQRYREPRDLQVDVECALGARPLMIAMVEQIPDLKVYDENEDEPVSADPVASMPRGGGSGSGQVLGMLAAIPPGFRRLIMIAVVLIGIGFGLSQVPDMVLDSGTKGQVERPAWAGDFGKDQYGHYADIILDGHTLRMRYCAPGEFTMGSPAHEAGRRSSEVQHQVTLSRGFWIAAHETPQAFFQAVLGADSDPSRFSQREFGDGGSLPVDSVTWHQAMTFCEALAKRFPRMSVRLPTEAEWEYACRAGGSGMLGAALKEVVGAWTANDELLDAYAQAEERAVVDYREVDTLLQDRLGEEGFHSRAVGLAEPNRWGLYDMHGNLAEWCLDAVSKDHVFGSEAVTDPRAMEGDARVLRGGSWTEPSQRCRAASRVIEAADTMDYSIGFRFVVPVQTDSASVD